MAPTPNKVATIPSAGPTAPSEDFYALRSLGLKLIGQMGHNQWTNYNASDPGITMLETMVYAITDLGYRAAFPIEDLLAQAQKSVAEQQAELKETMFHTAAEILPSSAVTLLDFRKLLSDITGVSNAWVEPVRGFQPFDGLRRVVIQLADNTLSDKAKDTIVEQVKQRFWANRNLGEALHEIQILKPHPIALDLQLVVADDTVPEKVLASALVTLGEFLESRVRFFNFADMLAYTGGDVAQVFDGPLLDHGFLPDAHLKDKLTEVDPDQLMRTIRHLPGITSVTNLQILVRISADWAGSPVEPLRGRTVLPLDASEFPEFDDLSKFRFVITQRQRPYPLNQELLEEEIGKLRSAQYSSKRASDEQDLPIPIGKYRNLEQYFTIQYDFPAVYNLRPGMSAYPQDDHRLAETNQLRTFLLQMDQVFANYLSQLANVGSLFSWSSEVKRTYFFQGLEQSVHNMLQLLVGLPDGDVTSASPKPTADLLDGLARFKSQLANLRETKSEFLARRRKFLDHLLARVGMDLAKYVSELPTKDRETQPREYIAAAERMLANYPALSSRRGTGGNPLLNAPFHQVNPGMQAWVEALLAIPPLDRQQQGNYRRLAITGSAPIASQSIFGQLLIYTEDGSPFHLGHALRLGVDADNYRIVYDQLHPTAFTLKLFGNVENGLPGSLFGFANIYSSVKEAMAAVEEAVRTFRDFSRASERFYFIDHILLRPFPNNPAFGMQILDSDAGPWMKTLGWYPLPAIEDIAGIQEDGTLIVTAPTDDPTKFVFQIFAETGGAAYPVYRDHLEPLPNEFAARSKTLLTPLVGQALQGYLSEYHDLSSENGRSLGESILADWIHDDLPSDWATASKADLLQGWGSAALLDILQRWQTEGKAGQQVGDEILAAVKGTPTPPNSQPAAEDRNLLVQLAKDQYVLDGTTGDDLLKMLETDLGNNSMVSANQPLEARKYLAAVGRALGRDYCDTFFGPQPMDPQTLGDGLPMQLRMLAPQGMETPLTTQLVQGFQDINKTLTTENQGKAFISNLVAAAELTKFSTDKPTLDAFTQLGKVMWQAVIQAYWPQASAHAADLGLAVATWLALPDKAAPFTSPLVQPVVAAAIAWMETGAKNAQDDPDKLGDWIWQALFGTQQLPADTECAFQNVAFGALQGYAVQVLAATDINSTDEVALELVAALGLAPTCLDRSLWPSGDMALDFYVNNLFAGQRPDAKTLGEGLIHDFAINVVPPPPAKPAAAPAGGSPTAPAAPAGSAAPVTPAAPAPLVVQPPSVQASSELMAIGAFAISAYLEAAVIPKIPKGGTASWVITAYDPKADPPAKAEDVKKILNAVVEQSNKAISDLLDGKPGNGWDLLTNVGCVLLDELLLSSLVVWNTDYLVSIDAAVNALLAPKVIGDLTPAQQSALLAAGYFFMVIYFRSRWEWQWSDATCLGNAVLSLWPMPASPPPPPPPIKPALVQKVILYSVSLTYYSQLGIPVELGPASTFPTYAATKQAITNFVEAIALVKTGNKNLTDVIQTLLRPETLGLEAIQNQHILEDPYSNMLTVIAPDWPLRFQERGFKERVEQILREMAPAHIWLSVLWLTKQEMQVFEESYFPWLAEDIEDLARDLHSRELTQLILQKALEPMPMITVDAANDGNAAS